MIEIDSSESIGDVGIPYPGIRLNVREDSHYLKPDRIQIAYFDRKTQPQGLFGVLEFTSVEKDSE